MTRLDSWRPTLGLLAALALLALAACGDDDFKDEPRPPVPEVLTGVINARRVIVSPNRVGAGPIQLTISNQSGEARTLTLRGASVEERVGPVNPQDTATIQKTLEPGRYELRAGSDESVGRPIEPAVLRIGPRRPASNERLLLP